MFGMSATTAALVGGGLGAAATIYGANKQASANQAAQQQNYQQFLDQQKNDWQRYLMQRGINPGADTQTGVIPTNGTPMNTKLPLWMTVNTPGVVGTAAPQRRRLVPIGTGTTPVASINGVVGG